MSKSIVKAALISLTAAAFEEGVSLLQLHVSITHGKTALPDPEHKSSMIAEPGRQSDYDVEVKSNHDFKCNGGAGNWVWVDEQPDDEYTGKGRSDLTERTTNIQKMWCRPTGEAQFGGERCRVLNQYEDPTTGWTEVTYSEHGPLRDEKDCFARARINYKCVHWSEDVKYGQNHRDNLGLWYKPRGYWGDRTNGTCYCGRFGYNGDGHALRITDYESKKGFWFCQLSVRDFEGVDENTPTELTTTTTTTTTTDSGHVCKHYESEDTCPSSRCSWDGDACADPPCSSHSSEDQCCGDCEWEAGQCQPAMFKKCPKEGRPGTNVCPEGCTFVENCEQCEFVAGVWKRAFSRKPWAPSSGSRPQGCFRNRKFKIKCNKFEPGSKYPSGVSKVGEKRGKWPICKLIEEAKQC